MKILVFAYHDIGCTALQTLHEMGHEICAVFTHEDDSQENLWFGSVKKNAEKLKIPTYTPQDPNTTEWIKKIKEMKPEMIFSFYYRKLICDCILAIPVKGGLNLHGSLLPKYRGRAPVNWVLVNGEKETGLTLHYMVKKPDAGDIVAQKKVLISEEDTAITLFKKLVPLTKELLLETVPLLANGTTKRTPQNEAEATCFGARKAQDGKIDWKKSSREIYNLVRAVTEPYPGAFTFWEGKKIFIWQSSIIDDKKNEQAARSTGEIVSLKPLLVSCGNGLLEIRKIQTENDSQAEGTVWAAKNRIQLGTILGLEQQ